MALLRNEISVWRTGSFVKRWRQAGTLSLLSCELNSYKWYGTLDVELFQIEDEKIISGGGEGGDRIEDDRWEISCYHTDVL